MLNILSITFPFFALVLCGYAATRKGMLPLSSISGLNTFVLFFALPCMLFSFAARTPIKQLIDPTIAGVYLLCGVVLVAVVVAVTLRRWGWNDAAFGALVAVFPNSGFMGVPMLVAILGEASAGVVILTMAVDMVVTTSLCIALSRLGQEKGGAWVALRNALRGMLSNPMPWAMVAGAIASAASWQLPAPLHNTVNMLATAASPVALFTIGAVLARSQMNLSDRLQAKDYVPVALVKLILHPFLVWVVGRSAQLLGMPLDDAALVALVLVAALPSASNVSLLTERFGAHSGRVAKIILVSTALAFLSFSGAVRWLVPASP